MLNKDFKVEIVVLEATKSQCELVISWLEFDSDEAGACDYERVYYLF